ncbi:MAG: LytTR family DNA-binding domain-containing protein [Planctomycetes bacterium]|nr:LytTR family DNA-binding domain-containing protein [Planctomycetota bacterium]
MEPLRVLIVDDEPPARKKLRDLLASECDFLVARECEDGDRAVEALRDESFDLALLDVQMPGRSGLDVVRDTGPARMPPTVFVTAFDEYAVRAFELHALDYLLKPFDRERFRAMLARARREIALKGDAHARRLEALVAELGATSLVTEPIVLRSGARTVLVAPEEFEWIEAADNYVRLRGPGGERLVRGTLDAIEALLAPRGYLRIHRSLLVNTTAVRELARQKSGELVLLLASGARLECGRTYRNALERRWPSKRLGEDA